MRFYGCRSGYIPVESRIRRVKYHKDSPHYGRWTRGMRGKVHLNSDFIRKYVKDLNGKRYPTKAKTLSIRNCFRRWSKKARFNDRMAIRNLMDTYYGEDRLCGECGYPLWLYSNPHTFKKFICLKYEGYNVTDCWG